MKALFSWLTLASCVLWSGGAARARGVTIGAGAQSCGSWTEARRRDDFLREGMIVSWVQGFLSGVFDNTDDEVIREAWQSIPDADALNAWLDKYCKENPLDKIYSPALSLRSRLYSAASRQVLARKQDDLRKPIDPGAAPK